LISIFETAAFIALACLPVGARSMRANRKNVGPAVSGGPISSQLQRPTIGL
jgi:hypothetical protein